MTIKMKAIKVIKIFSILIAILCSCGCEKDDIVNRQTDDKGVVIATPFLWKTSLHEKEPESFSFLKFPVVYNDNILVPTSNGDENDRLSLINSTTGEILWHWDDIFAGFSKYNDVDYYHQFNNLITWVNGGRSYCINMDNGSTHWKIGRDRSFSHQITPFGQYFFMIGPIDKDCEKYHKT